MNSVLRLQAIAGTPADREAALQECMTSNDLHAKQGPKITQDIEKLQAKLSGMERDASAAIRRAEQQADACTQLRTMCPVAIVDGVNRERRALEAGVGQDLRDAKSRQHELMCNLNLNNVYESAAKHIEYGLLRSLPGAVRTIVEGRSQRYELSAEWPSLKAECQREFEALTEKLPELQAVYDDAVRVLELPLDHYSDPKNSES